MPISIFAWVIASVQQAEASIEGQWRNPAQSVIIEIGPCGLTSCGRVQWASDKAVSDARKGETDPLIGAELLSNIQLKATGRWRARLFIPDLRKSSKVELRLVNPDRLKVTGCAVGGLVCRSQVWRRVTVDH